MEEIQGLRSAQEPEKYLISQRKTVAQIQMLYLRSRKMKIKMQSLALATWRSLEISDKHFQWSQFNCSAMPNSLEPHGLQHTRPPCPSPTPGACSNSHPLSWWCHPTISSSVVPFSDLQSFPASRSFQMSQLLASAGQSIGVSASTSVLPVNSQDWSPLGWTGWISLQSKGLWRIFSNTTSKASVLWCSAFFMVQLSHPYITSGKTMAFTRKTFVGKVIISAF